MDNVQMTCGWHADDMQMTREWDFGWDFTGGWHMSSGCRLHIIHTLAWVAQFHAVLHLVSSAHHLHVICRHICRPHVIRMSSACHQQTHVIHTLSAHCPHIVCMSSAYVHVIHILSGHMHIMHTLFAVVLDIFLPIRQCQCHPYVISSTLYISYHVQLSFCTLSAQMHIVHVICMLSAHVHIICTCTHHLLVISNTPCIPYYPQLSFCTLSTHRHIVNVICILSTDAYLMYSWYLLLLSTYVHVIHILSGHICTIHTLPTVVLHMFLPNRQCQCHPYIISSTLYISYHVQLSFCTLSAQTHIVHVVCMLSTHVHIICLSSLPLLIYLIIHNLVSAHCLHTCILSMSSVYCLEMHMLCTCHLYCCYLYMYMSSAYYLGIYILGAHYL